MKDYEGPLIGDAFGAALHAHWRGERPASGFIQPSDAQVIVERDDGHLGAQSAGVYFTPQACCSRLMRKNVRT